jgi:hypothetical protein
MPHEMREKRRLHQGTEAMEQVRRFRRERAQVSSFLLLPGGPASFREGRSWSAR